MRLHTQAHPNRDFAKKYFDSRWGKLESYVVLDVRNEKEAYIRLGFQHLTSKEEWGRIVFEQDIEAMDACFEKIYVQAGDVWYVEGGLPHAIGEGLTVLEVLEPTDLVVRCEFEREGIVVPPEARFMGRDPQLMLEMFDYRNYKISEIKRKCRIVPTTILKNDAITEYSLIGPDQTDSFLVNKTIISEPVPYPSKSLFMVCVVTKGKGKMSNNQDSMIINEGNNYFIAAAAENLYFEPEIDEKIEMYIIFPGENIGIK